MTDFQDSPELDDLCISFEDEWAGADPHRIASYLYDQRPKGMPISVLLRELLGIEFDMTSAAGSTPNVRAYRERFPDQIILIDACVGAWITRQLEMKFSAGEDVPVEDIAQSVDFGNHDPNALMDILEEEHRLRKRYELPTREHDYIAKYHHVWPRLKDRLIEGGLYSERAEFAASRRGLWRPAVHLQILTGPHEGDQFTFDEHTSIVVGRGSRCGLRMAEDPYFSRYHFRIEINPPQCYVIDLKSRNGTFVNGQEVPESALRHGDQVSAGQTVIRIKIQDLEGSPALPSIDPTLTWSNLEPDPVASLSDIIPPEDSQRAPTVKANDDASTATPMLPADAIDIPGYAAIELIATRFSRSVFRGKSLSEGESVAIKIYHNDRPPDPALMNLFRDPEAAYRRFEHRRVAKVLDIGRFGSHLFVVSEWVPSITPAEAWGSKSLPDRIRLACGVVCFALEALDAAHRVDAIHGNANPQNLLIVKQDHKIAGRLTDFGVALQLQRAGLANVVRASQGDEGLWFQAPERLLELKNATSLGDIYSMGATLFYFLSGKPPVEPDGVAASMASILNQGLPSLAQIAPGVPHHLVEVVNRAMHHSPSHRYQKASEFYRDLVPFTQRGE